MLCFLSDGSRYMASSGGEYPYAERGYTVARYRHNVRQQAAAKRRATPLWKDKHWNQCHRDFIAHLRQRNNVSKTWILYDDILRLLFTDPTKKPDQYTRAEIEHFLGKSFSRASTQPGPATHNMRLGALSAFYAYAWDYEYRTQTGRIQPLTTRRKPPTRGIALAKTAHRSHAMSDDELTRFFKAIEESKSEPIKKKRDRALFLTYLWTGRRRAEICGLRWRDIEICKWPDGRGKQYEAWVYHWRGKGHVDVDDCAELPQDAVAAIKEYLEADDRWGKMLPADPIFPGDPPTDPISKHRVSMLFSIYRKAACIEGRGASHRLRHTAGRARYEETHDIEEVQTFLRHKNIATTVIYVQSGKRQADTVAPRLHGRFGHL